MCDSHPKRFVAEKREFNWKMKILNDKKIAYLLSF